MTQSSITLDLLAGLFRKHHLKRKRLMLKGNLCEFQGVLFRSAGKKSSIASQLQVARCHYACFQLAFDVLDNPEMISLANFLKDRARTFFLIESIAI